MRIPFTVAVVVFALCACLTFVSPAHACINETYEELDALSPRVAKAKKALEQGKYLEASSTIKAVLPSIHTRARYFEDARPLLRRARIIALAATIRSNGRVVGKKTFDDENARIARLLEAYQELATMKAGSKRDRKALDELEAEVMARSENLRADARKKLEELAAKDLLTAPESWAALATLRDASGDKRGATDARQTCERRAADERQCLGFRADAPGRS